MARDRLQLQTKLEILLGTRNVYFQPPESIRMKYPCFVYNLEDINTVKADNKKYLMNDRYSLKYIDYDPDSPMIKKILTEFDHCEFDRFFTSSDLNHWVYTLYF